MAALELALLLLAAVLISAVLDQLVPKISLPLIQIVLGIGIALIASGQVNITLDPELFLVLFIAPLLYDEAKHADKAALWHEIKPVLSLAIGLVIATVLAIGFATNAIFPSISLAAAFALGAALGPTDAVAVSSLAREVNIPKRQQSILKGELLLNDASGIVSFQFAIAAAVTGTFSLIDATATFAVEFFGGLVLGGVAGVAVRWLSDMARRLGVENTTFHVLFEVFTPFLVYLISNALHVSGIIAVVVAGLVGISSSSAVSPSISRMNIVSSSVWRVISFALNGVVFVLLGTQLPRAMQHTWEDVAISNLQLVAVILLLTAILMAVRFVWTFFLEWGYWRRSGKQGKLGLAQIRSALIMTLSGPKGTITLSILFTIPFAVVQRELIIFLACGVILCTLLLSTFVVPLIAPKQRPQESETKQRESECALDILRYVVEELTVRQTPDNRLATQAVLQSYNERIAKLKDSADLEDERHVNLRVRALHWENEYVDDLLKKGLIDPDIAYEYQKRLERIETLLRHGSGAWSPQHWYLNLRAAIRRWKHRLMNRMPSISATERAETLRDLQLHASQYVVGKLRQTMVDPDIPSEDASALLVEYQSAVATLSAKNASISTLMGLEKTTNEVKRQGYLMELEQIQSFYEDERLCRASAKRMRDNVYLMLIDLEDHV